MRVISMQSPEVWNILQYTGVYRASYDRVREHTDYSEDIAVLDGAMPIWCWAYPELSFLTLYSGDVLENLRCEMSLRQNNCWDSFVMLEIEIDPGLLHVGKSHNACLYSCVFAELTLDMVNAVYTVRDNPDEEYGWYFKVITPIWIRAGADVITKEVLDCRKWDTVEDTYVGCFSTSAVGACLRCGKDTQYVLNGKHFCCLAHAWKHKECFIQSCAIQGMPARKLLPLYDVYTDVDFTEDYIKRMKGL